MSHSISQTVSRAKSVKVDSQFPKPTSPWENKESSGKRKKENGKESWRRLSGTDRLQIMKRKSMPSETREGKKTFVR
jgi:hypothetical protein